MTNKEERRLVALLRTQMGQGRTDYECSLELGVTLSTLSKLKQKLFSDELESVQNETAAETWVRYSLKQGGNITDLDAVITDAKLQEGNASALNARVGAIKAKADLIDRVHEKGQELGVIPTVAQQEKNDGQYPTEIPALRDLVRQKEALLVESTQHYGTRDFAQLPHTPLEALYLDTE